jgi:hypothetical protein
VSDGVRAQVLALVRECVCGEAQLVGSDLVAEGQGLDLSAGHLVSVRVEASAMGDHGRNPASVAGALITEIEEGLHFAALESQDPLTIVIS